MYNDNYITKSLELHLFFGRIMKEHAFFLKAGFTPADSSFANKAEYFKKEFENLLSQTVALSSGNVSWNVLNSGELVTEFTAKAERQSESFTGISINKDITRRELQLHSSNRYRNYNKDMSCKVKGLNLKALEILDGLISFKEQVLKMVLNCNMYTMNYPLLIEHIIREAKLYRQYVEMLENDGCLSDKSMQDIECFWNRIMMEHALFIRGLLDPTETDLINSANDFAKDYANLLEKCCDAHDKTIVSASLEQTVKFRDFKAAGTKGIQQCNIRSVILPLLADHVLREANHYIRLLNQ